MSGNHSDKQARCGIEQILCFLGVYTKVPAVCCIEVGPSKVPWERRRAQFYDLPRGFDPDHEQRAYTLALAKSERYLREY